MAARRLHDILLRHGSAWRGAVWAMGNRVGAEACMSLASDGGSGHARHGAEQGATHHGQ